MKKVQDLPDFLIDPSLLSSENRLSMVDLAQEHNTHKPAVIGNGINHTLRNPSLMRLLCKVDSFFVSS